MRACVCVGGGVHACVYVCPCMYIHVLLNLQTELLRPLWTHQRSTEEMRPNLIAGKNKFSKARFKPSPTVPRQSAQTDKSVSSAERKQQRHMRVQYVHVCVCVSMHVYLLACHQETLYIGFDITLHIKTLYIGLGPLKKGFDQSSQLGTQYTQFHLFFFDIFTALPLMLAGALLRRARVSPHLLLPTHVWIS